MWLGVCGGLLEVSVRVSVLFSSERGRMLMFVSDTVSRINILRGYSKRQKITSMIFFPVSNWYLTFIFRLFTFYYHVRVLLFHFSPSGFGKEGEKRTEDTE